MNLSISFRELLSSSEASLLLSCFGTFYSPHKSYLCDSDGSVSVIEDFVNIIGKLTTCPPAATIYFQHSFMSRPYNAGICAHSPLHM